MTRSPTARERALKRHVWNARLRFEATCAPGLEALLEAEVVALPGAEVVARRTGAVAFEAPYDALHHALLTLRIAEALRIVLIEDAAAATLPMLHDRAGRVDWSLWLPDACRVTLRVHTSKSRLREEAAIRDAVAGALRSRGTLAEVLEPGGDAPFELRLALHRDRMRLALTVDGALHRHWGEKWVTSGSLRDTTAAGIVRFARAEAAPDLILDPFCGSGTLLLAALDAAAGYPPRPREVAFATSPAWRDERARHALRLVQAAATLPTEPAPRVIGGDVDRATVDAARHNLAQAGYADAAGVTVQDAAQVDAGALARGLRVERPLLLSNPPYGRGADAIGDDPDALLGKVLATATGWRFALLYPRPDAIARSGATVEAIHPVVTGGLRNAVVIGRVDGSSRARRRTTVRATVRTKPQAETGAAEG